MHQGQERLQGRHCLQLPSHLLHLPQQLEFLELRLLVLLDMGSEGFLPVCNHAVLVLTLKKICKICVKIYLFLTYITCHLFGST